MIYIEIILDPTNFWQPALAVILAFVVANLMKVFTEWRKTGKIFFRGHGGMPSSHTASVVALATTVLLVDGLSLFFLAVLVFTFVVLIDAMGVRREAARHSRFLNNLVKKNMFKVVGHDPFEVFVGALIGIVVPLLVYSFL